MTLFFRGRSYVFRSQFSLGVAIFGQTVKAFQISFFNYDYRIFKMWDNGLGMLLAQHDKLSRKPADQCTPIYMGVLSSGYIIA